MAGVKQDFQAGRTFPSGRIEIVMPSVTHARFLAVRLAFETDAEFLIRNEMLCIIPGSAPCQEVLNRVFQMSFKDVSLAFDKMV